MSHHTIRAAEYRAKAHDLEVAAASSELAQVREKYEGAARRFAELADEEDLRSEQAQRNSEAAEARAEAAR